MAKRNLERRTFTIDNALLAQRTGDEPRVIEASLSSEEPVERASFTEILDHGREAVDLRRAHDGLPLLFGHDAKEPIGIVENIRVTGRRLVGQLRFGSSRRARDVWEDVAGGVLKYMSIGYRINDTLPEDDGDVMRITRWELFEASVVGIPADHTVGINRQYEDNEMTLKTNDTEGPSTRPKKNRELKDERFRVNEILALGKRHGMLELAEEAIRTDVPVGRFKDRILDQFDEVEPLDNGPGNMGFGGDRSIEDFSVGNVVRAVIEGDWSQAGFEREITQELKRQSGRSPQGILIPSSALATRTTLSSSNSGSLVGTKHMTNMFIETLRNESMVIQLGAFVLPGLSMNVSIPRMVTGTSASWINEGSSAAESTPTFDSVTLTANQLSARVSYSRKLLIQSNPMIEQLMLNDLRREIAIALDKAAINGSGSAPEPEGILNITGVGDVPLGTDGSAPTWDMVVDLAKEVDIDNALVGSLGYLTNSAAVAKMRKTPRQASGVEGNFILNDDIEQLGGYPLGVSNNVPSDLTKGSGSNLSAMIFGNWRDLLIGEFGTIDLIVDPYTNAETGAVRIAAHAAFDISVRHPQSFAVVADMVTT